jgi:uncharacterized protein YcbK (DUF882 family)
MELKYFDLSEFDSPDYPGSGSRMNHEFLDSLDKIREIAGIPFHINSGFRTSAQNKKDKGALNSAHLRGLAADIAAPEGFQRFRILQAALLMGVRRIGVGSNFIHLDMDDSLPNPTIWTY